MTLSRTLALVLLTSCGALVTQGEVLSSKAPQNFDDAGTPCTPRVEATNWPVKVVFVVENSGKMCILDGPGSQPNGGFCEQFASGAPAPRPTRPARLQAIASFFAANASRPNVSIAVIAYHLKLTVLSFRTAAAGVPSELAALQSQLGGGSDLQGALDAAAALIEADVQVTAESLRARSRYAVVVLGTGFSSMRCAANDSLSLYASPQQPALTWADASGAMCNATPAEPGTLAGFTLGGDRNQVSQLLHSVDGILALDQQYGLGDVRVHSRLTFRTADLDACGTQCGDLLVRGASSSQAHDLSAFMLGQVAQQGQGTFADPGDPRALTLDGVDTSEFTTFCQ